MKLLKSLNASVAAAVALAGVALSAPAHADPVTWSITGTVQYVSDPNGFLPSSGVSINPGDSASLIWTFDSANTSGPYAYSDGYDYSYVYSTNSGGAISAQFGGMTASASGDAYGYDWSNQSLYNGYSQNYVEPYAYQNGYTGNNNYGSLTSNVTNPLAASSYYSQSAVYAWFYNYANNPNAFYPSDTSFAHFDASNYSTQNLTYYQYFYDTNWNMIGSFNLQASITDIQRSDVPAPGALALLGLGLIGLGAVRRRKIAA